MLYMVSSFETDMIQYMLECDCSIQCCCDIMTKKSASFCFNALTKHCLKQIHFSNVCQYVL